MRKLIAGLFILVVVNTNAQWSKMGGNYPFRNYSPFGYGVGNILIDKAGSIYVAGEFVDAQKRLYVAKWDGTSWNQLSGSFYPSFGSCGIPVICTADMDTLNQIYAPANNTVAKWDGNNWSLLPGNFSAPITNLITDRFNNVYVSGYWNNKYGTTNIYKWDGSSWSMLDTVHSSIIVSGTVQYRHLATDVYGNLYADGYFVNDKGNKYIAKWNGSSWSELGDLSAIIPSTHAANSGWLNFISTDQFGNVYTSGNMMAIDSNAAASVHYNGGIAKWDGSSWSIVGGTNDSSFVNTEGGTVMNIDQNGNMYAFSYDYRTGIGIYSKFSQLNGNKWSEICRTNTSDFPNGIDTWYIDNNGNAYAGGADATGTHFFLSKYANTLSVGIISFTAKTSSNNVLLNWQALYDAAITSYTVERSFNGKDFESLMEILVHNDDKYSTNDKLINDKAIIYYRIKIKKQDGSVSYSDIKPVYTTKSLALIYPNPAKDKITIRGNCSEIKIVDITGRTVLRKHMNSQQTESSIAINGLMKGIYFVHYTINNITETEKLIVE